MTVEQRLANLEEAFLVLKELAIENAHQVIKLKTEHNLSQDKLTREGLEHS